MPELINLIVNNGIGVVCVAYLIYFQTITMKDLSRNQAQTNELLAKMTDRLENVENKLENQSALTTIIDKLSSKVDELAHKVEELNVKIGGSK